TIIPGIIQFFAPLTTAILAVFWLKQVIGFPIILGGGLIIAGVLFSLKTDRRKYEKKTMV
ncbi:MAG TPA: hypothetical protein PKK91_07820, partial [bacterium]|nr:hypothetical protein [bacterium]